MTNFTNISISAKDYENPSLLIMLDIFRDNSIYLRVVDMGENTLAVNKYIKNQHLLNIINAFLAAAKRDKYDFEETDYGELYIKYVELIAYFIISDYFEASLFYTEIKLIDLKEY